MPTPRHIDAERLKEELKTALHHGVYADELYVYSQPLVDMLFPPLGKPDETLSDRAVATERLIRRAVNDIGGRSAHALRIMFRLQHDDGTADLGMEERRREAARLLNIAPETFRKRREDRLILKLAFRIKIVLESNRYSESKP